MTFALPGANRALLTGQQPTPHTRPTATRFRRSRDTHPGQPMGTEQARSD
jgi:hypothetical protein